jgi:hypothetical protein
MGRFKKYRKVTYSTGVELPILQIIINIALVGLVFEK